MRIRHRIREGVGDNDIEVKVPPLPESVSEAAGRLGQEKGEFVNRDENLIDLETDKVALELPAPQAGVLVEIVEQSGATVTAGQVIARIDTAVTAGASAPAQTAAAAPSVAEKPKETVGATVAMPSAAKLAVESGIDLSKVQGSGRGGRVP